MMTKYHQYLALLILKNSPLTYEESLSVDSGWQLKFVDGHESVTVFSCSSRTEYKNYAFLRTPRRVVFITFYFIVLILSFPIARTFISNLSFVVRMSVYHVADMCWICDIYFILTPVLQCSANLSSILQVRKLRQRSQVISPKLHS